MGSILMSTSRVFFSYSSASVFVSMFTWASELCPVVVDRVGILALFLTSMGITQGPSVREVLALELRGVCMTFRKFPSIFIF